MTGSDAKRCVSDSECDDEAECSTDSCNGGICSNQVQTGYCLIDGECITTGTNDSGSPCKTCDPTRSTTDWSQLTCVTTLAGDGSSDHDDGPVATATFDDPVDVAVDSAGSVYVADRDNHSIRLIAGGQVSTFAGNGGPGNDDGAAQQAEFHQPHGVWLGGTGNVYVADRINNRLRLISGGQVSTLVQNDLYYPSGGGIDASGEILIANTFHHTLQKTPATGGALTLVAGDGIPTHADGAAASARFHYPMNLAVDSAGQIYVADCYNNRIRVVSGGQVSTLAGNGDFGHVDGPVAAAEFRHPRGIAVDAQGTLYVADTENHQIRMIAGGQVSTLAGNGSPGFEDGLADQAEFRWPWGVAVDSAGKVYVADKENHRIRVITQ